MKPRGVISVDLIIAGAAIAAVVAVLWGTYAMGAKAGRAEIQTKWDKAARELREKEANQANTASTTLETTNAKARIITREITVEVEKVVDRPVYRNICLDDDGLRLARCAIRGESPDTCKPDEPVRPPAPVAGRHWGLDLALDHHRGTPIP